MEFIIKNLNKKYDSKTILKDVNFTFEQGKIYALLGRNGAGKTTFFNCVNSDTNIQSGEFYIKKEDCLEKLDLNKIGYVLSTPVVPDFLTGREFISFFLEVNKIENPKTVDEYFDLIEIDESDRDKILKEYSHGMKNKIQILLNIISKPNLLLLDEPLTSFDIIVAEEIKNIIKGLKDTSIIILSTHILELALDLCDEIVLLHNETFELISKDDLNNVEFKNKIIDALRGDS